MHDHTEKEIEEKIQKHQYSKSFYCSNCGYNYTLSFNFGERAYPGICTHCGVSRREPDYGGGYY